MTRDEAKQIVRFVYETYSNWKPADMSRTVDIWATVLADDDFEAIKTGVINFIKTDTKGFAPSIGQVRASAFNHFDEQAYDDTEEMIAIVRKAVGNSYYGAEEEFAKMPKRLQRAVGNPSNLRAWGQTETGEFETVILSQVRRSYRSIRDTDKETAKVNPLRLGADGKREMLPFEVDYGTLPDYSQEY